MSCATVRHQFTAQHFPPHSHGEYQMIFVAAGQVRLFVGGRSYEVVAPAVMLLGNLETHSFESVTREYERYTVTVSPRDARNVIDSRLLTIFLPHGGEHSPVLPLSGEAEAEMRILFAALEEEGGPSDFAEAADSLVQLILLRLYRRFPSFFPRESSESGGLAEDVRRVLESDLEEKITLSELGERFHVSVYHLERLFRAQTGYAIGRYRLLCRIAAAREFLATTEMPVGEIAEKVGIGDISNFSRYFRRETGYTPQEYRKRAQGK